MAYRGTQLQEDLMPLVEHPDPAIRAAAVWRLGRAADPALIPLFLQKIADPEFTVRSSAGWALVALPTSAPQVNRLAQEHSLAGQMAALVVQVWEGEDAASKLERLNRHLGGSTSDA